MPTRSTRALMAGLFLAGLIYGLFALSTGRYDDPFVWLAIYIEAVLIVASLTQKPPTKKILVFLILVMIIYTLAAAMLGFLSEVAIMAIAGIALYAGVMTEPKFPLTKRAIATGLVVGLIYTFLGIYLALKVGVVYIIGAEMLGAIALSAWGKYTKEENTIVVAISNSSAMISVSVLFNVPAIAIFAPEIAPALLTYPFIVVLTGISVIFGLLLLAPLRERFEDEPWPQVRPQAETIISMGLDQTAKRTVLIGVVSSAAWVGATKIAEGSDPGSLMAVPNAFKSIIPAAGAIPEWIGISNSPLIASIGFFVGWKRALVIFAGSIVSMLIWIFIEGALPITYEQHLKRAEILYLAIGVFVSIMASDVIASRKKEMKPEEFEEIVNAPSTGSEEEESEGIIIETPHKAPEMPRLKRAKGFLFSIEAMREEMHAIVSNPRAYLRDRRGELPVWVIFISLTLYAIVGILIFGLVPIFPHLHIHWSLFVIGTPLVIVSAYFTARAICETGMLAGYISDMVAIPAVLLLRATFQSVTVFMSMLETLQVAAITLLIHLKLGRFTGVRGRDIAKAVSIGMVLSTFIGSLMIYAIYTTYGFGGSEFPSPAAQLFGFIVLSLQGIGNLEIPGVNQFPGMPQELAFLYLIAFFVAGLIAGRELSKRDMSPMSFVVGVLIPPATAVAMLFGAYIDYRVKKQDGFQPDSAGYETTFSPLRKKMSRILSGVVAGEAIVVAIWVIWSAIILFV